MQFWLVMVSAIVLGDKVEWDDGEYNIIEICQLFQNIRCYLIPFSLMPFAGGAVGAVMTKR